MYQTPESPQSIGGVLDSGFGLFRASFKSVFLLALIAAFASQIPGYMLTSSVAEAGVPDIGAGFFVALLIALAISLIFYGAIIARMHGVATDNPLNAGEALSCGLRRAIPLLICGILYTLATMLGLILLVIPGIIIGLTLLLAPYAVVAEKASPIEALKYSHSLVWGNWWRTAAILTIAMFILTAAYFLIVPVISVAAVMDGGEAAVMSNLFTDLIVMPLLTAIVTPLLYALVLAVYNDLKLRREGGDLAARIDAAPTGA